MTTEPTPDELEPIEETTEKTERELHLEGERIVVEDTAEGRTITATDAPDEPEPAK
jgi:hypothetical protein